MFSPKAKRNLFRIIPFGFFCLISNLLYISIEKGILGDSPHYPSTGNPYELNLGVSIVSATISGLIIGVFEVFFLSKLFKSNSFLKTVIYKTLVYLFLISIFLFANVTVGHAYELQVSLWDGQVYEYVMNFFSSFAFLSLELYLAAVLAISIFYTEVSDNIGQEVLINLIKGKYHQPVEEERIFMFLDMKSSTTIAEQLGHVEYFKMLKEYYADLSDPIIQYAGEIYQYVGDEVIVSWNLKQGLNNNNCIQCFFAMKKALEQQAKKYHETFGVLPSFKAGIHFGEVTTGEIGVIKKDITFSGDVLNVAARIQGLCNHYEVDILLSAPLATALTEEPTMSLKELGKVELRGRNEKMGIFTVEMEHIS